MSGSYPYHPHQQQQPQQFAQAAAPPNVFPSFQSVNVSPEMINFGLNAGQDLLSKQRERWMPGVSGFWESLKYYFAVDNAYVVSKLANVFAPWRNPSWQRVSADEYERQEVTDQIPRKWALPKQDVNAPDLYIPLMSFVTYVLLVGLSKGLGSANFSPEVIIQAVWRCLALQVVETTAIKFGTNMLSANVPFLDVFAFVGYKYVPLCVNLLVKMLNGTLGTIVALFCSGAFAYFVLKSFASAVPPSSTTGSQESVRLIMLPSISGSQLILVLILSLM